MCIHNYATIEFQLSEHSPWLREPKDALTARIRARKQDIARPCITWGSSQETRSCVGGKVLYAGITRAISCCFHCAVFWKVFRLLEVQVIPVIRTQICVYVCPWWNDGMGWNVMSCSYVILCYATYVRMHVCVCLTLYTSIHVYIYICIFT